MQKLENHVAGIELTADSTHASRAEEALRVAALTGTAGTADVRVQRVANAEQLKDMGFPRLDVDWQGVSKFDKGGRIVDYNAPVPIGLEPSPYQSPLDRLLHGRRDDINWLNDKYPSEYYPQARNAGIITLPGDTPEEFGKKYPTLVEYNRRAGKGDHEAEDYGKMVQKYVNSLDPKERDQIAKEYEQYTKDCESMGGDWGFARPEAKPGPHLQAYLEHVQGLKQASHANEQARRQAIAAELGPAFKKEAEQWESERKHNMLSM